MSKLVGQLVDSLAVKLLSYQKVLDKNHSEAIALSALEEPIRAELFSAERLEQHAESLAAAQRVTTTDSATHHVRVVLGSEKAPPHACS